MDETVLPFTTKRNREKISLSSLAIYSCKEEGGESNIELNFTKSSISENSQDGFLGLYFISLEALVL